MCALPFREQNVARPHGERTNNIKKKEERRVRHAEFGYLCMEINKTS